MNTTQTQNETLNNVAKEFNLFTADKLPEIYKKTQMLNGTPFNFAERIERDIKSNRLPSDILKEFSNGLFFEAKEQKNSFSDKIELYYINHSYRLFFTPAGNIAILASQKGKYYFHPYYAYFRKWDKIEYTKRENALKKAGISEPNQIGVFTIKKIQDWLNYCDKYINCMNTLVEEMSKENEKIENQINEFVKKSGGTFSRWGENPTVTVVNCGFFEINFKHYKKSQFMNHEIKFKGDLKDILNIIS